MGLGNSISSAKSILQRVRDQVPKVRSDIEKTRSRSGLNKDEKELAQILEELEVAEEEISNALQLDEVKIENTEQVLDKEEKLKQKQLELLKDADSKLDEIEGGLNEFSDRIEKLRRGEDRMSYKQSESVWRAFAGTEEVNEDAINKVENKVYRNIDDRQLQEDLKNVIDSYGPETSKENFLHKFASHVLHEEDREWIEQNISNSVRIPQADGRISSLEKVSDMREAFELAEDLAEELQDIREYEEGIIQEEEKEKQEVQNLENLELILQEINKLREELQELEMEEKQVEKLASELGVGQSEIQDQEEFLNKLERQEQTLRNKVEEAKEEGEQILNEDQKIEKIGEEEIKSLKEALREDENLLQMVDRFKSPSYRKYYDQENLGRSFRQLSNLLEQIRLETQDVLGELEEEVGERQDLWKRESEYLNKIQNEITQFDNTD